MAKASQRKQTIFISTKTGDDGTTSLANGERLPKSALIFDVLGTLDELNSWLGLVAAELTTYQDERAFILYVQDNLFHMGAELARSPKTTLSSSFLTKLDTETIRLQTELEPNWVSKFLLPGGAEVTAHLDLARSVCRRLERLLFDYASEYQVRSLLTKSANRLSDYLYVLRVMLNTRLGVEETVFDSKGSYTKKLAKKLSKK